MDESIHPSHAHLTTWAAGVVRQDIAAGRLPPGAKLSESALATKLSVSRNTLREAFAVLAGETIVKRIPNRGVFVAAPGAEEVRELYTVRRTIEPAAVLWGSGDLQHASAAMTEAIGRARAAKEDKDVARMADANQDFHDALVGLTGSDTLRDLMAKTLAEMRLVFHAMANIPDFHTHYVERNARIAELIAANERSAAAVRLREYLDAAEAELLGHLAAH